ncbi:alpha/beta hydrolase [Corynebacterium liangguodongii]|uniref:Alpha/beta hydrolase n=1 Tax=Corynebacterium liangguodongii TaxID=2079535 RepID=A0A2S0WDK4_9CORY|nr:alpha/beta hydrolase [Corynebacterium liangguodongii]PWB98966.1 alpha/beta hydrolase [Corynebacterium liangguodongii]
MVFAPLGEALGSRGVDMAAVAHGARGSARIDASAAELACAIAALPDEVDRVDIVGHSSGALVALRALAVPGVRERVGTLVGLGGAWRGTDHHGFLRPEWLVRLVFGESFVDLEHVAGEPALPEGVEVVSIVSDADSVVPEWSSTLGRVVTVSGVPHALLPGCTDEVLDALGL